MLTGHMLLASAYSETSSQKLDAHAVAELLPPGTELAHPPVRLALPSSPSSLVVLYKPVDDVSTNFQGWVVVPATKGLPQQKFSLPPMDEIPGQFEIRVLSVFRALPGKTPVLVVLYHYHRNGSADDSGWACYVYRWGEHGFESASELASKVVGLKSAAQVRKRLLSTR